MSAATSSRSTPGRTRSGRRRALLGVLLAGVLTAGFLGLAHPWGPGPATDALVLRQSAGPAAGHAVGPAVGQAVGRAGSRAASAPAARSALQDRIPSASRAERGTLAPAADGPVSFRIGTFNILSSWHTRTGRDMAYMAPGPMRAHLAAEAIRLYAPGVVGYQELDMDQVGPLAAELPDYNFYPGTRLDWWGVNNNIMWNRVKFQKISGSYITVEILGQKRANPYVKLRDRATGRAFWVMNVHNSPNRGGNQTFEAERRKQVSQEVAKIRELEATGLPVFLTGDMNDKAYTYCQFVSKTRLRAVQGFPGGCELPANSHIEWIFGSGASWSDMKYDRGPLLTRVTDHHVLFATATLR